MSDIRVCLLLSGQPRFYSGESYDSLKNHIIDRYNTHVFIHCWYSPDYTYPYAEWSGIKSTIKTDENTIGNLIRLYNPQSISVEKPQEFQEHQKADYLSRNMPSMFYSLKSSDALRKEYCKNHREYDFVIRARTDTVLGSFPDLTTLDKNYLYVPDNCPNPDVLNDNFSICGGDVIARCDVYGGVYNNLWKYSENGANYSPEMMWKKHLDTNGIKYKKLNFIQTFKRQ